MKFETPKIVINAFSENIVTAASGGDIENMQTVKTVKDFLRGNEKITDTNRILTFTFD